jgi:GNAT superfamily N-acetyltransferase
VDLRPVRPDECETAGAVVVAAYEALPGAHMSDGYAVELADVARRSTEAEVLVAVDGGLVGCVTFVPDPRSPWAERLEAGESGIRMLAVAPAAQGRGIGRALLGACVERGRQVGAHAILLHTTPWMTVAHRLYETAGFQRFPDRDWLPVPEVPLVAYRLGLTAGQ